MNFLTVKELDEVRHVADLLTDAVIEDVSVSVEVSDSNGEVLGYVIENPNCRGTYIFTVSKGD